MSISRNHSAFKPRAKNQALFAAALDFLKAERPMTLRQLYYRLASSGELLPLTKEYRRLSVVMTRAREAGACSRTWIVDHTRTTLKPNSWSGLEDYWETVQRAYRKDFWASMPVAVEVIVEKDAVAGTIQPVTIKYDVPIRVVRGFASVSFAGEIADEWARCQKPIYVYYLGDFDPSGFEIERDLQKRLERYSGRHCIEADPNPEAGTSTAFLWKRLAVDESDFFDFDLLPLEVKDSDPRAAGFIARHGRACAELDAIPPTELRRRVDAAIRSHIDPERWERLQAVEAAEKRSLEGWIVRNMAGKTIPMNPNGEA